ncbi:hypothetical protein [Catellatospora sichuanensis]|uniref:hypothetical protein n=1 Tax=Catellatospora sichuanensis TaxID=1969805 RepID=UPI001183CA19|nr:hypothetical protein [Catellatospora sichuanensis]
MLAPRRCATVAFAAVAALVLLTGVLQHIASLKLAALWIALLLMAAASAGWRLLGRLYLDRFGAPTGLPVLAGGRVESRGMFRILPGHEPSRGKQQPGPRPGRPSVPQKAPRRRCR